MSALPAGEHGLQRPKNVSAATFARVRDYVTAEPSFTAAFAAWELGLTPGPVRSVVEVLLAAGVVEEIEPRSGPYAAVYAYRSPAPRPKRRRAAATLHVVTQGTSRGELRDRTVAYVTESPRG